MQKVVCLLFRWSSLELVLKGKKDKCPAPTFPCFCFVDLLTVFLVQGQRQVSSFWSGQGLTLCVCAMPPRQRVCAEVGFEDLSVIQPCLVYQSYMSYMSHTAVIWSGAVSTRQCYSCSTTLPKSCDWLARTSKRCAANNSAGCRKI